MAALTDKANDVYRDSQTQGVPASGPNEPDKSDIRALFRAFSDAITNVGAGLAVNGAVLHDTQAALFSDLAPAANTAGFVWNDPDDTKNGVYAKVGAPGAGSWALTSIAVTGSTVNRIADYTAPLSSLTGNEYAAIDLPPESGFLYACGDASRRVGAGLRLDGSWGDNPGPDTPYAAIQIFGDSFVQGVGPNYQWWQHLRDMMTAAGDARYFIEPFGSGGQDASQIAGRLGARSIFVTLQDNTIPARGSVAVTNVTPQILTSTTDSPETGGPQICRLQINPGIWGTLQRDGDGTFRWYRETPGAPLTVPPNSVALADGLFHRDTNVIIAAGRNTADFALPIIRQEIDAMRRMQTNRTGLSIGGIIVGFTVASTVNPDGSPSGFQDESLGAARRAAFNAANDDLAYTYGSDFVEIQNYSVANAIRDLDILHGQGYFAPFYGNGGPGTLSPWPDHKAQYAAQDAADIAAGLIPTSLRFDGLHPNTYWAAVIAQLVFRRFRSKRY